uniref:Uncharacterized protein n=1 Tax=Pelodiscus sinensis TaxID=13735 RepID=K7EWI4_PELSI
MLKIEIGLWLFFFFAMVVVYKLSPSPGCSFSFKLSPEPFLTHKADVNQSSGIIFVETTDRLKLSPLATCSVESAARAYPDRPVLFFMKGLKNNTWQDSDSTSAAFALLSAMKNVFLLPFEMETFFEDTPLFSWYHKVRGNIKGEIF